MMEKLKDRLYELGALGIVYYHSMMIVGAVFKTQELANNAKKVIKEEYGLSLDMYYQLS